MQIELDQIRPEQAVRCHPPVERYHRHRDPLPGGHSKVLRADRRQFEQAGRVRKTGHVELRRPLTRTQRDLVQTHAGKPLDSFGKKPRVRRQRLECFHGGGGKQGFRKRVQVPTFAPRSYTVWMSGPV